MFFNSKFLVVILTVSSFRLSFGFDLKECGSLDIRSHQELRQLSNCSAILGNLALVFPVLEDPVYTSEEINSLSFPLREVTGYFLVYSLTHLDSLGKMFPNLTIIRGQRLFSNYAFVIYETDLVEISLRNLLKINRGSVKIGGINSRLCLPKIDWDRIIVNGKLFVGNNSTNSKNCTWMRFDHCGSCKEAFKCWTSKACQRFESSFLPDKRQKTKAICHPLCLGDCINASASGCFTCKDISEDLKCVEKCSESRLLNVDTRRCISRSNCTDLKRSIHENICVENCPSGYSTIINSSENNKSIDGSECLKCKEKCPKFCKPPEIRRVSQLEKLGTGCTIIDGDLEINMVEDVSNLTAELNTYLGDVEEIWGVLKIHRSPPLTELTFLNRLRIIQGRENRASILIFENQNLQTLFDWRTRGKVNLKLKSGYIQIYNNLLLCASEIKKTADIITRTGNYTDLIQNNGGKNKCSKNSIETSYHVWSHESCAVRWKDVNPKEQQKFNAYIIQYVNLKSTEKLNDPYLLERDSCSSYGWKQVFVKLEDWKSTTNGQLEYNLTELLQFTNYAFTVQTYQYGETTLDQNADNDGAISSVKTFRTDLYSPSRVKNLKVLNKSPSSVQIQWEIYENEIDAIQFFYVEVVGKPFNLTLIDRRDFCKNPIDPDEYQLFEVYEDGDYDDEGSDNNQTCCEKCCEFDKERKEIRKKLNTDFDDALVKLSEKVPRKSLEPGSQVRKLPNYFNRFDIEPNKRNYTVENLNSTTPYLFFLYVCSDALICSTYSLISETTERNVSDPYDKVQLKPASYVFESQHFHVYFDEPKVKNGEILNYVAELREVVRNTTVYLQSECLTRKQHEENHFKYSVDHLTIGNYVFRVRAVSLGGNGPFTDFHEFSIVKPVKKVSRGWVLLGAVFALLLICVTTVSYYYKHKIVLWKRQNDTIHLLDDMQPTDFHEISLHHESDDFKYSRSLEDIMEFEE